MASIVTLAEVKALDVLNIKNIDHDTFLQSLIDAAEAEFARLSGRQFTVADRTEYFDVDASTWRFRVAAWPITQDVLKPVTVYYDPERVYGAATVVDPDAYAIRYTEGEIVLDSPLGAAIQAVKITYNGGLSALPANAEQVIIAQVKLDFQRMKNLEQSSASLGGASVSYNEPYNLLPRFKKVAFSMARAI